MAGIRRGTATSISTRPGTTSHLDDFPFDKWVHRSHNPSCRGVLRLGSRGGGGLEGQVVTCGDVVNGQLINGCGKERSLRGITGSRRDARDGQEHTTLTDQLSGRDDPYYCGGARPWLAELAGQCGEPIRGALRAAGNVYFPKVESSIYLPRQEGAVSADLHDLMRRPNVGPVMRVLHSAFGAAVTVEQIRAALPVELFEPISDEEIMAGFRDLLGVGETPPEAAGEGDSELLTGDDEWRYPEYKLLRQTPKDACSGQERVSASVDPYLMSLVGSTTRRGGLTAPLLFESIRASSNSAAKRPIAAVS